MAMSDVPGGDPNAPADGRGEDVPVDVDPVAETVSHDSRRHETGPLDTGQLAFADEEVRLPWLEADDDDEEDYRQYGAGQLFSLLLLGVLALVVIGGGLWWALHHRKQDVQVADGSVIAAPRQPYKELPKHPGGKTFEGTGDTSFAVSEGQTRPAKLGGSSTIKPDVEASPKPDTSLGATLSGDTAGGVGVQVAAYSNRTQAEAGWSRLSGQYEALKGLHHRVVEGQADIGTVYRLQAVAGDAGAAHALCNQLKAAGLACQVKN
jgi:nitrogen fixation-related uncharacterized protein